MSNSTRQHGAGMAIILLSLVATAGCTRGCSGGSGSTAGENGDTPRTCEHVMADLTHNLTGESTTCEVDDDCTCFNMPYKKGTCGAVVNKVANGNLVALAVEAKGKHCEMPPACPDWSCDAYCNKTGADPGTCESRSPCRRLSKEFGEVLATGTLKCEKSEDCGSYQAGIADNCGGLIDADTAYKLMKIKKKFFANDCDYVVQCAPRVPFLPVCRDNVCVDGGGFI